MEKRSPLYGIRILGIVLFVGFLGFFMIKSVPGVLKKALDDKASPEFAGWSDELPQLQSAMKENLVLKNRLTDLASISDRVFYRIFTDNYTYLKDSRGMVFHLRNDIYEPEWVEDAVRVKQYADEQGLSTAFVYVQNPLRVMTKSDYKPYEFTNVDEYADRAKGILDAGGVDILDIREENGGYFLTDMHASTNAQVDAMRQLVEWLEKEKGLRFEHKDYLNIYDPGLYSCNSYSFVGGYCRSIGAYYTDRDRFDLYLPRFQTDYHLSFPNTGTEMDGSFQEVLVRIPDIYDTYSYWITNMAYYGQSIYRIQNTGMEGQPKLLFVMDSAPMTGICYLSAACSEVCVYDPRFSEGASDKEWFKSALGDYDAVIFDSLENSMDYIDIFN